MTPSSDGSNNIPLIESNKQYKSCKYVFADNNDNFDDEIKIIKYSKTII